MEETNKNNNNELNPIYSNGNLELKNLLNNANIIGSSDSYFDN